jgi:hypothetical protein
MGAGTAVEVKMTLTAQGCGMGPSIAADARAEDPFAGGDPGSPGGWLVGRTGTPDDHGRWAQEARHGLIRTSILRNKNKNFSLTLTFR